MKRGLSRENMAELFRFGVNGGVSFLVEYGLTYTLTEYAGFYYLISSAVGFAAAVVVNYAICVLWVFQGTKVRGTKSKLIFVGSSIAGLLFNQAVMWCLVDFMGLYYMLAKVAATGVVMLWNYVMKRKALVFDEGESA